MPTASLTVGFKEADSVKVLTCLSLSFVGLDGVGSKPPT